MMMMVRMIMLVLVMMMSHACRDPGLTFMGCAAFGKCNTRIAVGFCALLQ